MATYSAAICLWRRKPDSSVEILLVHPGGPFWARKDEHAWSLPKGEYDPETEDGLGAARREFAEELGSAAPDGPVLELGEVQLKSRKIVRAWALEGDLDTSAITSNTFEMQWPPKSGQFERFPEVDRAEWSDRDQAAFRLNPAQLAFVERLADLVD